jgi:lipopolysaccharide transport system permease protein
MNAAIEVLQDLFRRRRLLAASTRVELIRRYAGSVLGLLWVFINPLLFLGVYLFLYVVVFRVRLPEMGTLTFATYVFAGLVPYIAVMEVSNGSVPVIRANLAFVKNLVFPIVLIPVRMAAVGMITQMVGLCMVIVLAAWNHDLSAKIALLPLVLIIQFLLLLGLALLCSGFGMILPDFGYFLAHVLLFLMFISPIGFKPEMVPGGMTGLVTYNPISYMVASYRSVILDSQPFDTWSISIFAAFAIIVFVLGAIFFRRLRDHLVDYE